MKILTNVRFGLWTVTCLLAITAACSSGSPVESAVIKLPIDTTTTPTTPTDPNLTYIPATRTANQTPALHTAAGYPMQYWISVPAGWPGNRSWPIVINLPGASKDFSASADLFGKVRDDNHYPFIVITPVTLTNGGDVAVPRTSTFYSMPSSTWDLIDQQGRCVFDVTGLQAVIADVRNLYQGQPKAFLTAWSAGGHGAFALLFQKPEVMRAAALSGVNYLSRCITKEVFTPPVLTTAPERVLFPMRIFNGFNDPGQTILAPQQADAIAFARQLGFTNITTETVPVIGHDPMPSNVMAYFLGLLTAAEK